MHLCVWCFSTGSFEECRFEVVSCRPTMRPEFSNEWGRPLRHTQAGLQQAACERGHTLKAHRLHIPRYA